MKNVQLERLVTVSCQRTAAAMPIRAQWVCSESENSAIVAIVKRLGLISR